MNDDIISRFRRSMGDDDEGNQKAKPKVPGVHEFAEGTLIGPFSCGPDGPDMSKLPKELGPAVAGMLAKEMKNQIRDAACVAMIHNQVTWFEEGDCKLGVFRPHAEDGSRCWPILIASMGDLLGGDWNALPMFFASSFVREGRMSAKRKAILARLIAQAKAHANYDPINDNPAGEHGDAA